MCHDLDFDAVVLYKPVPEPEHELRQNFLVNSPHRLALALHLEEQVSITVKTWPPQDQALIGSTFSQWSYVVYYNRPPKYTVI